MSRYTDHSIDALVERHPLQRMKSPSLQYSLLLHSIGLVSFFLSFKHLEDNPNPANKAYGWHFIFLTIIGLALATLTFVVGFFADLTSSRRLFLVKNVLLFCSAPLETLITILYWGLRSIDKNLVVPTWGQLDIKADIGFHLMPSLLLCVDLLFFSPPWTIGALPSIALSAILAFSYWIWVEICYTRNGWYPYPLFEMASVPQRGAIFLGAGLLFTLSAVLLKVTYTRVNGREIHERPGDVKSKSA